METIDELIRQAGFWAFASSVLKLITVIVQKLPPRRDKRDRQ